MEDDIRNYRIVGIPDRCGAMNNCKLIVLGYINYNGMFISMDKKTAHTIFAPDGRVFAYDFYIKQHDLMDCAVEFSIKAKESSYSDSSYANYIWDFKKETKPFGYKAKVYPIGSLSENGEVNDNFEKEHNFIEGTHYVVCDGYMYRFSKKWNTRSLIERWNLNNQDFVKANQDNIVIFKNNYIILSEPSGKAELVDRMSNMTLMYWFLGIILPKEYPNLKPLINSIPQDKLLNSIKGLDESSKIMSWRIRRAMNLLNTVELTKEQFDKLAKNSTFNALIKSSVEKYGEEYIKKAQEEYSSDLEKLHKEYEAKKKDLVDDLEAELQKEKAQISSETSKLSKNKENLEKDIDALEKQKEQLTAESETLSDNYEKEIKRIEGLKEQKGKILNDFQVVKDVISLLSTPSNVKNDITNNDIKSSAVNIEAWTTEGDELQDYEDFDDNIKAAVNGFGFSASSSTLTSLLAKYKIVLLPDARLAYSIAKATGKCYVATSYVGIDWQSFNDLWNSGLSAMVNSCSAHEDVMHYFILQNINLSYLPSYIQPLLDVADGYLSYFPGSGLTFPKNLRILCVACDDKGIPMNESCLKRMGCYPKGKIKEKDKIEEMPSDLEYLTPDLLNNADIIDVDNSYQSYIEDDED